jgi:hypothetical protein
MSDDENKPVAHVSRWLIAAILIFIVYPLSVGPVVFIAGATTGHRPNGLVVELVYGPLELIARAVPAIGRPLGAYVDACNEEGRRWKPR